MLTTLCIETSSNKTGGVALLTEGDNNSTESSNPVEFVISFQENVSHSEALFPALELLFSESNKKLQDVQRLVVTRGPGNFTGIRVGINAAKTFSYAFGLPVLAPTTFEVMRMLLPDPDSDQFLPSSISKADKKDALLLLPANQKNFYGQAYTWNTELSTWTTCLNFKQPMSLSCEEVEILLDEKPHLVICDALSQDKEILSLSSRAISQTHFLPSFQDSTSVLPLMRWVKDCKPSLEPLDWIHVQPLYLRRSEAEEKLWKSLT